MSDRLSVGAVVVTYNRLAFLKGCIEALRGQTHVPDEIIVVNNSSTDGTGQWLTEQHDLVVLTQPNSGSSGGQHAAVKAAYERGHDWIWIMDDDVVPAPDGLAALLAHATDDGCVYVPLRIWHGTDEVAESGALSYDLSHSLTDERRMAFKGQYPRLSDVPDVQTELEDFSFEGPLISRRIVSEIGAPSIEYFISYDDTDYSCRVRRAAFRIVLVPRSHLSRMIRPLPRDHAVNWKTSYLARNRIWINRLYGQTARVRYIRSLVLWAQGVRWSLSLARHGDRLRAWELFCAVNRGMFGRLPRAAPMPHLLTDAVDQHTMAR